MSTSATAMIERGQAVLCARAERLHDPEIGEGISLDATVAGLPAAECAYLRGVLWAVEYGEDARQQNVP